MAVMQTLSYLESGVQNYEENLDGSRNFQRQSLKPSDSHIANDKQTPDPGVFDVNMLNTPVKEALIAFSVARDESYGAAIEALWTMREKLASQNPEQFLRLYIGLCIKVMNEWGKPNCGLVLGSQDSVHALTLPPALMHSKVNTIYSSALDFSSARNGLSKKLFTASQHNLFKETLWESWEHFKSVSECRVKREKLLADYETSEFGSKLSSTLQALAKLMFPEVLKTKQKIGDDIQAPTGAAKETENKKNTEPSNDDEGGQNLLARTLNVTESQLKSVHICLVPLDQRQDRPVRLRGKMFPTPVQTRSSRLSSLSSDSGNNSLAKNKGAVTLRKCCVSLKRLVSYDEFIADELGKSNKHKYSSTSEDDQSITATGFGLPLKHNELSSLDLKRKRTIRKSMPKKLKAGQTNKKILTDSDTEVGEESVPSSDLEDSDIENFDTPCSDSNKRQKTSHPVPIPDLQQFIRRETGVDKTTPCCVFLERIIL